MLLALSPADLDVCARTLAFMDDGQPDYIRTSVAWVIRNRLTLLAVNPIAPLSVPRTCHDILREAIGRFRASALQMLPPSPDWCHFHAVTRRVWTGDVEDQTCGATSCHRHDRAPGWAKSRAPTALIGPYLFYR